MPFSAAAIGLDSGTVLVLITLLAIPIAAVAFARSGPAWKSIGKGPLAIEPVVPPADAAEMPAAADPVLRDEVRQHVEAENARRRRQGRPELAVEAETERRIADLIRSGR